MRFDTDELILRSLLVRHRQRGCDSTTHDARPRHIELWTSRPIEDGAIRAHLGRADCDNNVSPPVRGAHNRAPGCTCARPASRVTAGAWRRRWPADNHACVQHCARCQPPPPPAAPLRGATARDVQYSLTHGARWERIGALIRCIGAEVSADGCTSANERPALPPLSCEHCAAAQACGGAERRRR